MMLRRRSNIYGFRTNAVPYYRRAQVERWKRFNRAKVEYILPSVRVLTALVVFFAIVLGLCHIVALADPFDITSTPYRFTVPDGTMLYSCDSHSVVTASKLRVRLSPSYEGEEITKLRKSTFVYREAYYDGWVFVSTWPEHATIGWVSSRYLSGGSDCRNATIPYGGGRK